MSESDRSLTDRIYAAWVRAALKADQVSPIVVRSGLSLLRPPFPRPTRGRGRRQMGCKTGRGVSWWPAVTCERRRNPRKRSLIYGFLLHGKGREKMGMLTSKLDVREMPVSKTRFPLRSFVVTRPCKIRLPSNHVVKGGRWTEASESSHGQWRS